MLHRIPHTLPPVEARSLVDELFAVYGPRYARHHPELEWLEPTRARFGLAVAGQRVEGVLTLEPNAVAIDAIVPWSLRPFRRLALRILDREARKVLTRERERSQQKRHKGEI